MGHSLEFLSLYFACEHSEIFPSIIYCALLVFLDSWMHQKTQNSRDETTAMETHFYTTEIFFSFMRIFLYTFRNIPYNFFNLFSYFQNNECKKSRNSRGKTRAMESHFYSMEFFFSFTRIFQNTFRNIPYNFFFMLFSYFQNNECKKISKFEREDKSNGIPLVQHGFFFPFTRIFLYSFRNFPYNFLL